MLRAVDGPTPADPAGKPVCLPCRKELAEAHKTNKPCGKCCFYLMISKTFVGAGKSSPGRRRRSRGEDELLFANAEEEFFHEVRPPLVGARTRAPVHVRVPERGHSVPRIPQQLQLTWCVAHAGSQVGDECGEETVCERAQGGWCFNTLTVGSDVEPLRDVDVSLG